MKPSNFLIIVFTLRSNFAYHDVKSTSLEIDSQIVNETLGLIFSFKLPSAYIRMNYPHYSSDGTTSIS